LPACLSCGDSRAEGDGTIWVGLEELYRHAFFDRDGVEYLEELKARGRRCRRYYPFRYRADKA
jgi:hypothetical protein